MSTPLRWLNRAAAAAAAARAQPASVQLSSRSRPVPRAFIAIFRTKSCALLHAAGPGALAVRVSNNMSSYEFRRPRRLSPLSRVRKKAASRSTAMCDQQHRRAHTVPHDEHSNWQSSNRPETHISDMIQYQFASERASVRACSQYFVGSIQLILSSGGGPPSSQHLLCGHHHPAIAIPSSPLPFCHRHHHPATAILRPRSFHRPSHAQLSIATPTIHFCT